MFYLSRGEQIALGVLVALLLAGAGLLTFERGVRAGRQVAAAPVLSEPKGIAVPGPAEPPAGVEVGAADAGARPERSALAPQASSEQPPPKAGSRGGRSGSEGPRGPTKPRLPISLNRATAEELDALPGIGPVYAQRIIQYREQLRKANGRGFTSTDELLNVAGIGPKRYAAVRDLVVP